MRKNPADSAFILEPKPDFERHNEEANRVWEAFHSGNPIRVPVSVIGSISNLLCNPGINKTGYGFQEFFTDPEAQIACQLHYQEWVRHNLLCDSQMGLPGDGWQIGIDFQNSYEAGWFGCPLRFFGDGVPDTEEIIKKDKQKLYDLPDPDPLKGNLLGRAMEFFEYMHDKCPKMEFRGLRVKPPATIPGECTDGPLSVAYKLRGAAEVCIDMYEDAGYFHDLMKYVTDNIIRRMKAIREWRWGRLPESPDNGRHKMPGWGFADDAVAMLSEKDYQEFVYPYHKRLVSEFSDGAPVRIHLCGDATRHFKFLHDHLNVREFDTGFPVDFAAVRGRLGPDVLIKGGPTVMLLKEGSLPEIREEVSRICSSGIMDGGRFIMIAANNLAPRTPVENIKAMYEAVKKFGFYG